MAREHLRALVEVTVGRGPDLPALPMLPGQTTLAATVAEGIVAGGEVASGYKAVFELTDDADPAPEPD